MRSPFEHRALQLLLLLASNLPQLVRLVETVLEAKVCLRFVPRVHILRRVPVLAGCAVSKLLNLPVAKVVLAPRPRRVPTRPLLPRLPQFLTLAITVELLVPLVPPLGSTAVGLKLLRPPVHGDHPTRGAQPFLSLSIQIPCAQEDS